MAASSEDVQNDYCDDFLQFQDKLQRMRTIDDKIIYELNNSIPTDYFAKGLNITDQCKNLYEQLNDSYRQRRKIIDRCVTEVSGRVNQKREEFAKDRDNIPVQKLLRKEQHKLRAIQQELSIDEVIQDRTLKAYYERCRNAYKPPIEKPPTIL